jgi:hypothetical protein
VSTVTTNDDTAESRIVIEDARRARAGLLDEDKWNKMVPLSILARVSDVANRSVPEAFATLQTEAVVGDWEKVTTIECPDDSSGEVADALQIEMGPSRVRSREPLLKIGYDARISTLLPITMSPIPNNAKEISGSSPCFMVENDTIIPSGAVRVTKPPASDVTL